MGWRITRDLPQFCVTRLSSSSTAGWSRTTSDVAGLMNQIRFDVVVADCFFLMEEMKDVTVTRPAQRQVSLKLQQGKWPPKKLNARLGWEQLQEQHGQPLTMFLCTLDVAVMTRPGKADHTRTPVFFSRETGFVNVDVATEPPLCKHNTAKLPVDSFRISTHSSTRQASLPTHRSCHLLGKRNT